MTENLFEAQYNITKKSKLRDFYESNKILIFSSIFIFVILFSSISFYFDRNEKKKIALSENYIQAKIYLEKGDKNKAKDILKEVIFADDSTYSTLSFFLILNQNLIKDHKELGILFDHLLENNKFKKEVRNLLIFKKILLDIDFLSESELLEAAKPLLDTDTLWKAHLLLLLGDYFSSKNEYLKAKEFYTQIFAINNLHKDFYDQTRSQLALIVND